VIQLTWEIPPSVLADGAQAYGRRVQDAIVATARIIEPRLEAHAKDTARWTDRTGNARAGLSTATVIASTLVEVFLFHTMDYGIFLEVAHAGKYAALYPSVVAVFPEVFDVLRSQLT
jgi:hypothetical protein